MVKEEQEQEPEKVDAERIQKDEEGNRMEEKKNRENEMEEEKEVKEERKEQEEEKQEEDEDETTALVTLSHDLTQKKEDGAEEGDVALVERETLKEDGTEEWTQEVEEEDGKKIREEKDMKERDVVMEEREEEKEMEGVVENDEVKKEQLAENDTMDCGDDACLASNTATNEDKKKKKTRRGCRGRKKSKSKPNTMELQCSGDMQVQEVKKRAEKESRGGGGGGLQEEGAVETLEHTRGGATELTDKREKAERKERVKEDKKGEEEEQEEVSKSSKACWGGVAEDDKVLTDGMGGEEEVELQEEKEEVEKCVEEREQREQEHVGNDTVTMGATGQIPLESNTINQEPKRKKTRRGCRGGQKSKSKQTAVEAQNNETTGDINRERQSTGDGRQNESVSQPRGAERHKNREDMRGGWRGQQQGERWRMEQNQSQPRHRHRTNRARLWYGEGHGSGHCQTEHMTRNDPPQWGRPHGGHGGVHWHNGCLVVVRRRPGWAENQSRERVDVRQRQHGQRVHVEEREEERRECMERRERRRGESAW